MRPSDTEDPVDRYARAAALAAGLTIDDTWWPSIVRHLGVLLARAASLEAQGDPTPPADPAPVFTP
ncbi:MAG: 1-carboxybiuret hydrolase subunit AtzG-like [Acidimicrobiaceae bacterium]|nr:1-carboxybiuret hydrolase subunit AtzG-like [Acidimicrobiaceae bacterium]